MTAPLSAIERAASFQDPVAFNETWLRRKFWSTQQRIARAITERRHVAVKGCHASGKTFTVAGLVLWFLASHEHGKVINVAPTLRQVKLLWDEIAIARRSSRVFFPETSTTGLKISEERYGVGVSSSRGVNLQGFHGDDVLIIVDEAPGIDEDIFDAIDGISAGGRVHRIELGNPTVPAGHFFDNFARGRAACECITISAFNTPNLFSEKLGRPLTIEELLELPDEELDYAPFPFLVTRRWVKERYARWGGSSPKFQSRVLGEFPAQSEYAVFELSWIEKAKREPTDQELKEANGHAMHVGIDVAGAGSDETTLVARVNGIILRQEAWNDADARGPVCRVLHELTRDRKHQLAWVIVDVVGVGYNFALHLRDQGFPVHGFVAGARANDPTRFVNQKAEAYFSMREYLKDGLISNLTDEDTEAQLSTINYHETSRGLTEIESKDEAKRRGLSSPDRAEALIMAFSAVPQPTQTISITDLYPELRTYGM